VTQVVTTERLSLVALPADVLDAMIQGDLTSATGLLGTEPPAWWAQEELWLFGLRRDQLRADPAEEPWLLRAMVTRATPLKVVGQIGFHESPDEGGYVEVGYMVFPEERRQGYAEEAFRGLVAWAYQQPGVQGIRAAISPENEPSLNLAAKFGFVETGSQIDEIDGLELIFQLPRSRTAP
jgi:[ribosomal protein S5]-alanine N-acetyltransferase